MLRGPQTGIGEEPDVSVFPRRRGVIVFCNTRPNIALIRGEDEAIYASTDQTTLQDITRTVTLNTPLIVTFIPVIGMGIHSACSVEVEPLVPDRTNSHIHHVSNVDIECASPNPSYQSTSFQPVTSSSTDLERLIHDRLGQNEDAIRRRNLHNGDSSQANIPPTIEMNCQDGPVVPGNCPLYQQNSPRDTRNLSASRSYANPTMSANKSEYNVVQKNVPETVWEGHPRLNGSSLDVRNNNNYAHGPQCENIVANREHQTARYQTAAFPRFEQDITVMSESELHQLLNKWYNIPEMFNKDSYPFPCEGFVVLSNNRSELLVFTRRLGCITRKEDPQRKGRPYAYFLVCGPNSYKAWEYEEKQPPTFKSTKYVNSQNIEMKGYALMAPGNRNDPENMWYAWNDQTGFMRCLSSCARILKKKYSSWAPTGQMVMFDATSNDNGRHWSIKTISYVDFSTANQALLPAQAYYIDDLEVMPMEYQKDTKEHITFFSQKLKDKVHAKLTHVKEPPKNVVPNIPHYAGIVFATWGHDGLGRQFQTLMVGPQSFWATPRTNFEELSKLLQVPWSSDDVEHFLEEQKHKKQILPSSCSPTLLKPAQCSEEQW